MSGRVYSPGVRIANWNEDVYLEEVLKLYTLGHSVCVFSSAENLCKMLGFLPRRMQIQFCLPFPYLDGGLPGDWRVVDFSPSALPPFFAYR